MAPRERHPQEQLSPPPRPATGPTFCLRISRDINATKSDIWSRKTKKTARAAERAKVWTAGMGVRAPGKPEKGIQWKGSHVGLRSDEEAPAFRTFSFT